MFTLQKSIFQFAKIQFSVCTNPIFTLHKSTTSFWHCSSLFGGQIPRLWPPLKEAQQCHYKKVCNIFIAQMVWRQWLIRLWWWMEWNRQMEWTPLLFSKVLGEICTKYFHHTFLCFTCINMRILKLKICRTQKCYV